MIAHSKGDFILTASADRNYTLTTNTGRTGRVSTRGTSVIPVEDDEMEVIFAEGIHKLKIKKLTSWTDLENPDLKFFSGRAVYSINFIVSEDRINTNDLLYLSLGEVHSTAMVTLNGQSLGTVWMPNYRLPVKDILKEGENFLEVEVANVYRNRIIGDLRQSGELVNIWTSAPVEDLFNPDMEPRTAGLTGPVVIIRQRPVLVNFDD